VERPVSFIDDVFSASSYYDCDCFRILGVAYVDKFVISNLDLFDQLCLSKSVFGEFFDASNYSSSGSLGQFLKVSTA